MKSIHRNLKKNYFSLALVTAVTAVAGFAILSACSDHQAKAKLNFLFKDAPRPGIVAKIGGEDITEDALIGEDKMDFFELKKREYELRMDRLKKLLTEKLVGVEAKKLGMSTDDYISKKILGADTKISDAEYNKFVAEKKIPPAQINPQIKERIYSFLQEQKKRDKTEEYVATLTKNMPVEVYFKKPKIQVNVDVGDAPVWGNSDAKVTIVEFSDFQCPFCSRAADTVGELKKKYGGKVKIAFRHFPLPMHAQARPAAEASMCVYDQNKDKFWKFHDLVFQNQQHLDAADLDKYAKQIGVDAKKFTECVTSKKFAAFVQKEMDYGNKVGVKSTPTFFINGELVSGALPLKDFSDIIDEELAAK